MLFVGSERRLEPKFQIYGDTFRVKIASPRRRLSKRLVVQTFPYHTGRINENI